MKQKKNQLIEKYKISCFSADGFPLEYADLTYSEALKICNEAGINPILNIEEQKNKSDKKPKCPHCCGTNWV